MKEEPKIPGVKIPEDMRRRDLEKKLKEEQGISCGACVSIRDLLILLQEKKDV